MVDFERSIDLVVSQAEAEVRAARATKFMHASQLLQKVVQMVAEILGSVVFHALMYSLWGTGCRQKSNGDECVAQRRSGIASVDLLGSSRRGSTRNQRRQQGPQSSACQVLKRTEEGASDRAKR